VHKELENPMVSYGGDRRRRRSPVVRWIIIAFVVCALAEPVVMYELLAHERQVRAAAVQSMSSTPTVNVTAGE
jgi:hypothetical protein